MSQSYWSERHVSSPSGAVYEITTTVNPDGGLRGDAFLVYLAVADAPDNWDLRPNAHMPFTARPVVRGEAAPPSDQACSFTPEGPNTSTRTTVPVDWYRVAANRGAHSTEDRRRESTWFRLPQQFPIEVALKVSQDSFSVEQQLSIERVIDHYERTYGCSAASAYATWLYDAALVLSDDDHAALVRAVEDNFADVDGVVPNVLSASDLNDDGDRLVAMKGAEAEAARHEMASGWLLADEYVRLDWTEPSSGPETTTSSATSASRDDVRDWRFRRRVLQTYGTACALCGLDIETPDGDPEVEAAHVYARQAGGPDEPSNGLPLCHLHHWAYDAGWLALSDDYEVLVADAPDAAGADHFEHLHGAAVQLDTDTRPNRRFVRQHRERHGFETTQVQPLSQ